VESPRKSGVSAFKRVFGATEIRSSLVSVSTLIVRSEKVWFSRSEAGEIEKIVCNSGCASAAVIAFAFEEGAVT
jgi:hypothetical protein